MESVDITTPIKTNMGKKKAVYEKSDYQRQQINEKCDVIFWRQFIFQTNYANQIDKRDYNHWRHKQ